MIIKQWSLSFYKYILNRFKCYYLETFNLTHEEFDEEEFSDFVMIILSDDDLNFPCDLQIRYNLDSLYRCYSDTIEEVIIHYSNSRRATKLRKLNYWKSCMFSIYMVLLNYMINEWGYEYTQRDINHVLNNIIDNIEMG